MKKKSITFVATSPKSFIYISVVAIFMATTLAHICVASNIDYQYPIGCYTEKYAMDFGELKETDSFYLVTSIFIQMPKSNEKLSKSNNSTLTLPSFHETELKLKQAASLPEISNVLITLCEQLGNKVELHVHFIIGNDNITMNNCDNNAVSLYGNANSQSIGNVTNSTLAGCNVFNKNHTGHISYGDYSHITGNIQENNVFENNGTVGVQGDYLTLKSA